MPYGELISQLRVDLRTYEADLKRAEELAKKTVQNIGNLHAQIGSGFTGSATGAGRSTLGGTSSPDRAFNDEFQGLLRLERVEKQRERTRREAAQGRLNNIRQEIALERELKRLRSADTRIEAQGDRDEWNRMRAAENVQRTRESQRRTDAQGRLNNVRQEIALDRELKRLQKADRQIETQADRDEWNRMLAAERVQKRQERQETARDRIGASARQARFQDEATVQRNRERELAALRRDIISRGERGVKEEARERRQAGMAEFRNIGFVGASERRAQDVFDRGQAAADKATAAAAAFAARIPGAGSTIGDKSIADSLKRSQKAAKELGDILHNHGARRLSEMTAKAHEFVQVLKTIAGIGVVGGIVALVKHGIELNAQWQRLGFTMRTVMDMSANVRDARTGKLVTNPQARDRAINTQSNQLLEIIRDVAAPTNLTMRELATVTSENLGFAMNAGVKLGGKEQSTKVVRVFAQIAQLAKNMGLPGGERQLSQEIRALFEGDRLQGASVAKLLGFSKATDIQKFKEKGTLPDELLKRLEPAIKRTTTEADRFSMIISTLMSKFDTFVRLASGPAFDMMSKKLSELNKHLKDKDVQEAAQRVAGFISKIGDAILHWIDGPGPKKVMDFIEWLGDNWKQVALGVGAFKAVGLAIDGVSIAFERYRTVAKGINLLTAAVGNKRVQAEAAEELAKKGATTGARAFGAGLLAKGFRVGGKLLGGLGSVLALKESADAGMWLGKTFNKYGIPGFVDTAETNERDQADTEKTTSQLNQRPGFAALMAAKARLKDAQGRLQAFNPQATPGVTREMLQAQVAAAEGDFTNARTNALALGMMTGTIRSPLESAGTHTFESKRDFRAEMREKRRKAEQMLRAFTLKSDAQREQQIRGEGVAEEIKLQKQFADYPDLQQKAIRASRAKTARRIAAEREDNMADEMRAMHTIASNMGKTSQGILFDAKADIFEARAKVHKGDLDPKIGQMMVNSAAFHARKELSDRRRDAEEGAVNLRERFRDETEATLKRRTQFKREMADFEKESHKERIRLLKEELHAQRALTDAIEDQKRAEQDVAFSRERRTRKKEVEELFKQGGLQSTINEKYQTLLKNSQLAKNLPQEEISKASSLSTSQLIRRMASTIGEEGGLQDVATQLKHLGINLTPEMKRRLADISLSANEDTQKQEELQEQRAETDDQKRLREAGEQVGETKQRTMDAKDALKEFPEHVKLAATELRDNFNKAVRESATAFRELAKEVRKSVEEITGLGGKRAAQTYLAPLSHQSATIAGHLRSNEIRGELGPPVTINVDFKVSPEARHLADQLGKVLERDARRVTPKR